MSTKPRKEASGKSSQHPVLIITGMHRSGTSLTASTLQAMGIELGSRLIGPAQGNPKGHFEHPDLVQFHSQTLAQAGIEALGQPTPRTLLFNEDQRMQADALVAQCEFGQGVWGWKDPRASFFLEAWRRQLPNARFVFVYRSPWQVVDSLLRRGTDPALLAYPEWALGLWQSYNEKIVAFAKANPTECVVVHSLQVATNPDSLVQAINTQWGWSLQTPVQSPFEPAHFQNHLSYERGEAMVRHHHPEAIRLYEELRWLAGPLAWPDPPLAPTRVDGDAETANHADWLLACQPQFERASNTLVNAWVPPKPPPLHGCVDAPTGRLHLSEPVHIIGWCAHPNQRIQALFLRIGHQRFPCLLGGLRDDVEQAFPDWVGARTSGFEAEIIPPPGIWSIALEAHLESGDTLSWQSSKTIWVWPNIAGPRWVLDLIAKRPIRWRWNPPKAFSAATVDTPPNLPKPIDRYEAYLSVNQWQPRVAQRLQARLQRASDLPSIAVIMPVYNADLGHLDQAIKSVIGQVYPHWRLCIADDASTDQQVINCLTDWARKDPRIQLTVRERNGNISLATNTAASQATEPFLLFLDQDDVLAPNALAEIALHLKAHPTTDVLYTDDDKISEQGRRYAPQFKPDWSPELLLSFMYLSHALVVRRSLFESLGGFREGFEGAQDFDFALRASEQARRVGHVPLVLYHWRATPQSTASSGAAKPLGFEAGRVAVEQALQRRKIVGEVTRRDWAVERHLGVFAIDFPDEGPLVAIVIASRNNHGLLSRCLQSLATTTYNHYRVVIIDNDSDDPDTQAYLRAQQSKKWSHPFDVLRIKNPETGFSFAHIHNQAVQQIDADYVLFLNDDTEVINPRWLSQMMGYAQMDGVGSVGARLLYPNQTLQHAGVVFGLHQGFAGHAFKLMGQEELGYLCGAKVSRNFLALTAACLLTPKAIFESLGGFDAERFAVAYNDADYGFRLHEAGYTSVLCPEAELIHHEGASRGFQDHPEERAAFRARYGQLKDPFYSRSLSLADERFEVSPRHVATHDSEIDIKPHVLMCAHVLNLTGGPLHQYEIASSLVRRGAIQATVFATADGPLRALYEEAGIEVIVQAHPLAEAGTLEDYQLALKGLGRDLDIERFDVVYANTLEVFYMVDCAHRFQVPSIWNIHESQPWQTYFAHLHPDIEQQALACFQWPYQVIFVSQTTEALFAPLNSRHNFVTIHNGLDTSALETGRLRWPRTEARTSLSIGPNEVCMLCLGTVCERKGQHDLVRALAQLPSSLHSRLRCFIVGDRPSLYSTELHDLVGALPETLRHRIEVVEETPETARYYQAADVFVCTSYIESYPRVILEAMGFGLPIVTTPIFGITEQVVENINGVFFQPGDTEALAKELQKLIDDDAFRHRLAGRAKAVLSSLTDFDEMTAAYLTLFQEASMQHQSPPRRSSLPGQ